MHILLCEDELIYAALVSKWLSMYLPRSICTAVRSLKTAVAALRSAVDVDVIILDLTLPDASSTLALRTLVRESPGVPIIVLTGGGPEMEAECIRLGARLYLLKENITGAQLMMHVQTICAEHGEGDDRADTTPPNDGPCE